MFTLSLCFQKLTAHVSWFFCLSNRLLNILFDNLLSGPSSIFISHGLITSMLLLFILTFQDSGIALTRALYSNCNEPLVPSICLISSNSSYAHWTKGLVDTLFLPYTNGYRAGDSLYSVCSYYSRLVLS